VMVHLVQYIKHKIQRLEKLLL